MLYSIENWVPTCLDEAGYYVGLHNHCLGDHGLSGTMLAFENDIQITWANKYDSLP